MHFQVRHDATMKNGVPKDGILDIPVKFTKPKSQLSQCNKLAIVTMVTFEKLPPGNVNFASAIQYNSK